MMLTYKYRVKDETTGKHLVAHSRAVNFVWNYCCQIQREAEGRWKAGVKTRWPSAFDLIRLCTGSAKDLGLHSDTVKTVCQQFVVSRDVKRKCPRFRASGGAKRSLGWVPFVSRAVKIDGDCAIYLKKRFRFWRSREVEGVFKTGAFVQDACGRWYVTFQCEVAETLPTGNGEVGIDLGLKTLAVCSDGKTVPALRHYRRYQAALATASRANNKARVKAIHAKIANSRKHHLHEQSTVIVRANSFIAVGNVNAANLAKTKMAKSVLDAGWSTFRNMLEYKARRHRASFYQVDERWSSQTCSYCRTIPGSSPKGMGALEVRHWVCSNCNSVHDRDLNAALNILRVGRERSPLVAEIPGL